MKEIVIISGKGGTGKTSLVASFATLAKGAVLADCDVDAADLHLVIEPETVSVHDFSGGKKAQIIQDACTSCGKCVEACRFDAISYIPKDTSGAGIPTINSIFCEGCGVCRRVCEFDAISMEPWVNGKWYVSNTRCGPMVHARLGMAEGNSGKLVSLIRQEAGKIAKQDGHELVIVDGSPGIGCPVIASITGADLVVVVTEPTLSGQHDLGRVAELTSHFGIPTIVCVNKWDINPDITAKIEQGASEKGLRSVGRVRYDANITKAQIAKKSVVEYSSGGVTQDIKSVWTEITDAVG